MAILDGSSKGYSKKPPPLTAYIGWGSTSFSYTVVCMDRAMISYSTLHFFQLQLDPEAPTREHRTR